MPLRCQIFRYFSYVFSILWHFKVWKDKLLSSCNFKKLKKQHILPRHLSRHLENCHDKVVWTTYAWVQNCDLSWSFFESGSIGLSMITIWDQLDSVWVFIWHPPLKCWGSVLFNLSNFLMIFLWILQYAVKCQSTQCCHWFLSKYLRNVWLKSIWLNMELIQSLGNHYLMTWLLTLKVGGIGQLDTCSKAFHSDELTHIL